jgi:hypothetical protein
MSLTTVPISAYPKAIDGASQLPLAIDGVTRINAFSVNSLRAAILNIENELGVRPGNGYSTVRARLDALELSKIAELETRIGDLESQIGSLLSILGDVAGDHGSLSDRLNFYDDLLPDESLFLVAGEDLLKGNLLRITNLGKVRLANAYTITAEEEDIKKARVVGTVSNKYDEGESARVYATVGTLINVRFDELEIPISTNNGQLVYLSTVDGLGTLDAPTSPGTVIFSIGILQGANGVNVAPKVVFQPSFIAFNP